MHLNELKVKKPQELLEYAESLGIENASGLKKQDIYFSVLKKFAERNEEIDRIVNIIVDECKDHVLNHFINYLTKTFP